MIQFAEEVLEFHQMAKFQDYTLYILYTAIILAKPTAWCKQLGDQHKIQMHSLLIQISKISCLPALQNYIDTDVQITKQEQLFHTI